MRCNNVKKKKRRRKKTGICRCVIQHDIAEHSGCCFYARASGECAFVWKCVTHTKELRAAWPSWCCCHADMEPSASPGELKPCREEISALLRENSVKTKASHTRWETRSHFSYNTVCHWEKSRNRQRAVQTVTAQVLVFPRSEGRARPDSPAGL